jgi:3D (Asp-Asp-Asp) domain-containing protein
MKTRIFLLFLLVAAVLVIGSSYLPDIKAAGSAVQYEIAVQLPNTLQPHLTRWQKLTALLGARSAIKLHPEPGTKFTVQASAYAPSPYQTDSTPCITAAGTHVRRGVVATNFLPLGTLLDINGQPYIVEDRMNPRYDGYYLDVWLPSTSEALTFGRKGLTVTVVGYGKPGQSLGNEAKPQEAAASPSPEPSGFLDRVRQGVSSLAGTVSSLIGARAPQNANQHDINCFTDDTPDQ